MTAEESYELYNKLLDRDIQNTWVDPNNCISSDIQVNRFYRILFNNKLVDPNNPSRAVWGVPSNTHSMGQCADDKLLYLNEGGFLASADTWANKSVPDKYTKSISIMIDTRAFYFDATRHSTIELMLNDKNLVIDEDDILYARKLINKIVFNKLSKYNHQPIYTPKYGDPNKKKVLVVDQSGGDWSIRLGRADENTFMKMLNAALNENPDCEVLVKVHPDIKAGKRKSCFSGITDKRVILVSDLINPYCLFDLVDKVYVVTSGMGFEALMAGKEVHTFGMPFYAGWGLTIDDQKNEFRTNKRSLEEIFYLFYCEYTRYVNPETNKECDCAEAINYLIKIRKEYFDRYKVKGLDSIIINNFKKCIVYATDTSLNNNIMFINSYCSLRDNKNNQEVYLITTKDNPFLYYYRKFDNIKLIFIQDYINLSKLKLYKYAKFTKMSFARLLVFNKKLFSNYDVVVWIDTDTTIISNLDKLFMEVYNSNSMISAASEKWTNNKSIENFGNFCKDNNLVWNKKQYVNCGVLGVNISEVDFSDYDNLVELASKYDFHLGDQGLLNYYFQDNINLIKSRYNYFGITNSFDHDRERIIIHYPGTIKLTGSVFGQNYLKYVYEKKLH